jgi:hypothetical protein
LLAKASKYYYLFLPSSIFWGVSSLILTRYRGVVECGQVDLEKEITMPKPQPSFTAKFKHEAVQLTKTSDKPKARRCGWSTLAEKIGDTGVDVTKAPALPQSERKRGK